MLPIDKAQLQQNKTALKIIVASLNPAKIEAAHLAFTQLLPNAVHIIGVDVPSGVAAQPISDAETYQGARQRALAARALEPDADLWVGMEGGVAFTELEHDCCCTTFAWIQVLGPEFDNASPLDNASRSASLTLPPAVAQALIEGEELGPAMDRLFNQTNTKQTGGAIGILTHQLLTRRTVYRDTLILALAPWLNPELYG